MVPPVSLWRASHPARRSPVLVAFILRCVRPAVEANVLVPHRPAHMTTLVLLAPPAAAACWPPSPAHFRAGPASRRNDFGGGAAYFHS